MPPAARATPSPPSAPASRRTSTPGRASATTPATTSRHMPATAGYHRGLDRLPVAGGGAATSAGGRRRIVVPCACSYAASGAPAGDRRARRGRALRPVPRAARPQRCATGRLSAVATRRCCRSAVRQPRQRELRWIRRNSPGWAMSCTRAKRGLVGLGVLSMALVGVAAVGPPAARHFRAGITGLGDPFFPSAGNGGYDVTHYGLTLSYEPSTNQLSAPRRSPRRRR